MGSLDKYRGVFPAFYACYDDQGGVSETRARRLARHLVDKGVKGLYVGGSSGECIYLEKEERMRTLEAVMQEVGGQCTIIAHVACNNTAESCQLAEHAEQLGVDAIASIPPIYFHLPDAAIARYWNDISDAAPHTDFFIYNIPQLAGVALSIPLAKQMQRNPRVVGVKNSSMPAYDIEGFKPGKRFCRRRAHPAFGEHHHRGDVRLPRQSVCGHQEDHRAARGSASGRRASSNAQPGGGGYGAGTRLRRNDRRCHQKLCLR